MDIHKHIVTVDNIVLDAVGRNVLLIRRSKGAFENYWAFPGGLVDEGETIAHAAQRELQEETGLTLEPNRFKFHRYSDKQYADPRGPRVGMMFIAEVFSSMPVEGADDAVEAKWFDWDEALNMQLAFDHSEILREVIGNA